MCFNPLKPCGEIQPPELPRLSEVKDLGLGPVFIQTVVRRGRFSRISNINYMENGGKQNSDAFLLCCFTQNTHFAFSFDAL